jgi:hypothetical protein
MRATFSFQEHAIGARLWKIKGHGKTVKNVTKPNERTPHSGFVSNIHAAAHIVD